MTIDLLDLYFNKYGYFVAYDFTKKDMNLNYKVNLIDWNKNDTYLKAITLPTNLVFHVKEAKWQGLFANIYYSRTLNIKTLVSNFYNKIRMHFYENSPYLKEFNLEYIEKEKRDDTFKSIDMFLDDIGLLKNV